VKKFIYSVFLTFIILFGVSRIMPHRAMADDNVSIPWVEFKQLYHDRVAKEIKEKIPKEDPEQILSMEESRYILAIGEQYAKGEVVLSGKLIQGKEQPIALFDSDIIIDSIKTVTGGALFYGDDELPAILFRPDGTKDFKIDLSFFIPIQEDAVSRFINFEKN